MDYSFNAWLNYKYDKKLYRYNVIDYLYQITLNNLNIMSLTLKDEEYFFKDFIHFIYYHSKKENYRNKNETKLFKVTNDTNRELFDYNYQDPIIKLITEINEYLEMYGFYDIFNSKNKESNFMELIYKNINFNVEDYTSESDCSEDEYILD